MLIDALLAFGLIAVVPLALSLERSQPPTRIVVALGLVSSTSLLLSEGPEAALLAAIWALVPAIALGDEIRRWRRRGHLSIPELVPILYLLAGAGWLVLSRYGARPMGFGRTIVELTAVHFHYAGFVAPVAIQMLVRWLGSNEPRRCRWARAAHVAVLAATPLTATGIAIAPAIGGAGAMLFAAGLVTGSTLTLTHVVPSARGAAALLLGTSALSVAGAMVLAVVYALGQWLGTPAPGIAAMARSHGVLNAIGFSFLGVAGWRLQDRENGVLGDARRG